MDISKFLARICGSCDTDDAKKEVTDSTSLLSPHCSIVHATVSIDGFTISKHKLFDELFTEGAKCAIDLTNSPDRDSGEECGNKNVFTKSKSRSRKRMKSNVGPRSGTRIKMKRGLFTGVSGMFIRTNGTKYVVRMDGGRGVRKVAKDDIILL